MALTLVAFQTLEYTEGNQSSFILCQVGRGAQGHILQPQLCPSHPRGSLEHSLKTTDVTNPFVLQLMKLRSRKNRQGWLKARHIVSKKPRLQFTNI